MKIIPDTTAMADWLQTGVPWLLGAVWIFGALLSSGHALLNKREVGAVTSWVALVWLAPLLGIGLYWVLGVNRVRRRAVKLRARWSRGVVAPVGSALPEGVSGELRDELAPFVERVANRPLCTGNAIDVLVNGDETYPAMLSAIEGAKQSICLLTYIFDTDKWGLRFIEALAAAKQRGVQVKVLVDALGVRYSRPCADRLLLQRGVDAKRFLPLHKTLHFNLRNHRKL